MAESSQGVIEWSIGAGGATSTAHTVEADAKIAADAYGATPGGANLTFAPDVFEDGVFE